MLGILKTTWRAMESLEWQGDPSQQGGSLVIDQGMFSQMML